MNSLEKRKCNYCGKEFVDKEEKASLYISGKLGAVYCSSYCMSKAFKETFKEMSQMKLFDDLPTQSKPQVSTRCKDCKHIQKWQCGGSFFFYCGITKSRRTYNGLKKVLCKTPACELFEKKELVK